MGCWNDVAHKVLICDPERLDRASGFLQDAGIKTILCQSGPWIGDKKNVTMTWEDAILVGNRYIAHVIRAGGTADKVRTRTPECVFGVCG
jgi:hypothetical protein